MPDDRVLGLDAGVPDEPPARASSRRVILRAATLPLPPSINAYWAERIIKAKTSDRFFPLRYVTHAGKKYREVIVDLMGDFNARAHSAEPLALRILVCPADARKQDLDNRVKVLQDCLKDAGVFDDDSQIEVLEVRRGPKVKRGCVLVSLREIDVAPKSNLKWIYEDK